MNPTLFGIHHVTAVARDPKRNLDFYTRIMGLRCVKRTVDFDEPDTYHFYFGDAQGTPGTLLTFFPWTHKPSGRVGTGQASVVSFRVPTGALGFWEEHLSEHSISYEQPVTRFENTFQEEVLTLRDPDGLYIELVSSHHSLPAEEQTSEYIPLEFALVEIYGVTLAEQDGALTERVLTELFGLQMLDEEGTRKRYAHYTNDPKDWGYIDVLDLPNVPQGETGPGTIHHVAFRVQDDIALQAWRSRLVTAQLEMTPHLFPAEFGTSPGQLPGTQLDVTGIRDRKYFHSIYFDEPGGVLFELATDPPGFAVDEPLAELGTRLQLPSGLEPQRDAILQKLPPLE